MVIIHPVMSHLGRVLFIPIRAKKVVIISTGHTMHQTRPIRIADKIIRGHQNLHTKLVVRFVLLSCLRKLIPIVLPENPIKTRARNDKSVNIRHETGKYSLSSSLFILFNIEARQKGISPCSRNVCNLF